MKRLLTLTTFLLIAILAQGQTYVDIDASGSNDGTSWTDAYNDLQDAINAAAAGDEIWVADGTYHPNEDHQGTANPADRDNTFYFDIDIKLYGGFNGTETMLSQANPTTNVTILSGDFNNDDNVTGSGSTLAFANHTENAYHVMIVTNATNAAIINGFTFKGGYANSSGSVTYNGLNLGKNIGAGLAIRGASPSITDCIFEHNSATSRGGAMSCFTASPVVSNCTFQNNYSADDGGGLRNESNSDGTFTNCTFTGNLAADNGGGSYNLDASTAPTFTTCTFSNNAADSGGAQFNNEANPMHSSCIFTNNNATSGTAGEGGGAVNNFDGTLTMTDCSFTNNTSSEDGGGLRSSGISTFTNCTFTGNTAADDGGAIISTSTLTLIDCVLSSNITTGQGGGIYNADIVAATNTLFYNNSSTSTGGGIYSTGASRTVTLNNCTFYENATASSSGGGAIRNVTSSTTTIRNCIFWNNEKVGVTNVSGADVSNSSGTINISYSLTQENSAYATGTHIINNQDPLFVNIADPDGADDTWFTTDDGFYININSPAANRGNVLGGNASTDIVGTTRPSGGVYDFGAYEYIYNLSRLYVDKDAIGNNDGSSWTDAFTDLQDALDYASIGDEVWVADGTYKPSKIPHGCSGCASGNTDFVFAFDRDIKLYGGFNATETLLSEADPATNITILSGDVNDDDDVTGAGSTLAIANNSDNTFRVMVVDGLTNAAVIDGFTLKGGNSIAGGSLTYSGTTYTDGFNAGIAVYNGSPTIADCIFTENSANNDGGGMGCNNANPLVTNCTFSKNIATGDGGGLRNESNSDGVFTNCTFIDNLSADNGGGSYNLDNSTDPTFTDCTFTNNSAASGGGQFNNAADPILNNCTFTNNSATSTTAGQGGGGVNNFGSTVAMTDCTFTNNTSSEDGGGLRSSGITTLTNCTFTGNTAADDGGAIIIGTSALTLIDCVFSSNIATDQGGAIFMLSPTTATNTLFYNNASTSTGGAIYNSNSILTLNNSTFHTNTTASSFGGGAIRNVDGTSNITNCIFWNNEKEAANNVSGADISNSSGTINISYSLTQENSTYATGTHMINNQDPLFVDAADPDGADDIWFTADDGFNITAASPAANRGSTLGGDASADIVGTVRPSGGIYDFGAYEYLSNLNRLYVDKDAVGNNDGSSWTDAFTDLQNALDYAKSGDEVWVADGTYKPSKLPHECTSCSGVDDYAFAFDRDIKLYGGFNATETLASEADPATNVTILSGDINGDDAVSGAGSTLSIANNADNTDRVMMVDNLTNAAEMDGFTITGANAVGSGDINYSGTNYSDGFSGGMAIYNSSPTITNCIFTANSVNHDGGGVGCNNASPLMTDCIFNKNIGGADGAGDGGGLRNENNSVGIFTDCTFSENRSYDNGGGNYNFDDSNATFTTCTFSNNYAATRGGGQFNNDSDINLNNCTFDSNIANDDGGGLANFSSSTGTVSGCTFSNNTANDNGGGSYNLDGASATFINCVFESNMSTNFGGAQFNNNADVTVTNCAFNNNTSDKGAGQANLNNASTMTNCVFTNNTSTATGGAMYNNETNTTVITVANSTFYNNAASSGGGIRSVEGATSIITNCIFNNNTAGAANNVAGADISKGTGTVTISYSLTQENSTYDSGTGIINNQDPLFASADLDGADDTWFTADDGLFVQAGSPILDAGTDIAGVATNDIVGAARLAGSYDLGAYEGVTVLPVELLHFNAKRLDDNTVQLDWQTASETNNKGFEIERLDGEKGEFEKIVFVEGNGTTSNQISYQRKDDNNYKGTSYYRLKQLDFDGRYEYSNIVSVSLDNNINIGNFYPNPSSDGRMNLDYYSSNNNDLNINIFDLSGKLLHSQTESINEGNNALNFDFSNLNQGAYLVELNDGENRIFRKIVIR